MPRKPIRKTIEDCPDACGAEAVAAAASTPPNQRIAPHARRERSIARILASGADPLAELARLMESADPAVRLAAARALAPFLYPTLRATELTGGDGAPLTVEIRKAD